MSTPPRLVVSLTHSQDLDLTPYANGEVEVEVDAGQVWQMRSGSSPDYWLRLVLPAAPVTLRLVVRKPLLIGVIGTSSRYKISLAVDGCGADKCRVVVEELLLRRVNVTRARVDIDPGRVENAVDDRSIDYLEGTDAVLHMSDRKFGLVQLYRSTELRGSNVSIGDIRFLPGAEHLIKLEGSTANNLTAREKSDGVDLTLAPGSVLRADSAFGLDIAVSDRAAIELGKDVTDCEFRGKGSVTVTSAVTNVRLHSGLTLSIGEHGQVAGASGSATLAAAANATILGDADGFTVDRIVPDADIDGLTLTNLVVPVTPEGLHTMARLLTDARHVEPLITPDLPGMDRRRWKRDRLRTPESDDDRVIRTEYVRALSELAHAKSAPASARTQLAWSFYRMRNAVASSKHERRLLTAYRTIGYGERAMPAFITYVAAVMAATFLTACLGHSFEPDSLDAWKATGGAFIDWLATPLHILQLTDPTEDLKGAFDDSWITFLRVAVAVPFATGVLAMRKYVKN